MLESIHKHGAAAVPNVFESFGSLLHFVSSRLQFDRLQPLLLLDGLVLLQRLHVRLQAREFESQLIDCDAQSVLGAIAVALFNMLQFTSKV